MIHFLFSNLNTQFLYLKFDTPEDELWLKSNDKQLNLTDHLNLVDPKCNLKTYHGPRVTEDFLFSYIQPSGDKVYYCSIGLWQDIYKFFRDNKIPYDGLMENQHYLKRQMKHSFEEFKAIVDSWELSLQPRPYQYEAAYKVLQWRRSVSELCTRAGKTLIAYMVFRYCIEELGMSNILMIVPSVDLVKQAVEDFSNYKEFFKSEQIWSGGKEVATSNFTVGTFQSLIKYIEPKEKKYNPHFFDKFDCVFVDETHKAKANQIKNIISQPFMKDVIIAFGMTGTLPPEKTIDHYCIFSLLGAKIQAITTKMLKDLGYISDIEIFQYRLHYENVEQTKNIWTKCVEYALGSYIEDENKKRKLLPKEQQEFLLRYVKTPSEGIVNAKGSIFRNSKWDDIRKEYEYHNLLKTITTDTTGTNSLAIERMMIHFYEERINILSEEIIPKCPRNTLILAHHTEYINHIVDVLDSKWGNSRPILKITGSITSKKRDKIKAFMKEHENCILVASYGCMSTGITLPKLCYGILFESFKSSIVNMQSIGRGLGLVDGKDKYILYDFVDCFDNEITNKIFLQGLARIKIYEDESNQHKYSLVHRTIGKENGYKKLWKEAKAQHKAELQEQEKQSKETSNKFYNESMNLQLTFDFE